METDKPRQRQSGNGKSRIGKRKAYSRPVLVKLGSLRELTMATTGSNNKDGGSHGNAKFTGRGGRVYCP